MGSGVVRESLRARCLAWWRFRQYRYHSKWDGLHPKRFNPRRWEAQLVQHYGEAEVQNPDNDAGWILAAQGREDWRAGEQTFAARII